MSFLRENLGTIVVGVILLAIVALIIIKMLKDKKRGKSSCGCGCEHCQNAPYCHPPKK